MFDHIGSACSQSLTLVTESTPTSSSTSKPTPAWTASKLLRFQWSGITISHLSRLGLRSRRDGRDLSIFGRLLTIAWIIDISSLRRALRKCSSPWMMTWSHLALNYVKVSPSGAKLQSVISAHSSAMAHEASISPPKHKISYIRILDKPDFILLVSLE